MIHTKQKIADFGEVFTSAKTVEEMLDMLDPKVWGDPGSVFVETSCGEGAFLTAILRRRVEALKTSHTLRQALSITLNTVCGREIQRKNAQACLHRLHSVVAEYTDDEEFLLYAAAVLQYQIKCGDGLKFKMGPCFDQLPEDVKKHRIDKIRTHNQRR